MNPEANEERILPKRISRSVAGCTRDELGAFRGVEHEKEQSFFSLGVSLDFWIGCASRGGRVRGAHQFWKCGDRHRGAGRCPRCFELDQDRGSVGKSGRSAIGQVSRNEWPGLFFIIPIIDTVPAWVDTRVITGSFKAEKTLTKDTVPVDVDAVLFWKVLDAKKSVLNVADYQSAISWASQTALRDVIGKTQLSDMLEGRERLGTELQKIIDERTEPWGINVISVEVKDVLIPLGLENAMSMQAQAERERQARVILGDSERQVAEKFVEAGETYTDHPIAFHLRAMNMLYEGIKENSTIVVVPSSALESMELGNTTGLIALTKQLQGERAEKSKANSENARRMD